MPLTQLPDDVDVGHPLMTEAVSAPVAMQPVEHAEAALPRWRVALLCVTVRARILLRRAVERAGGQIVADAPVSSAAIALLEHTTPEIVILEPAGRDHAEVELLTLLAAPARCAWVLLTGDTSPRVLKLAQEAGIMACLVEPLQAHQVGPSLDLAAARFRDLQRGGTSSSERVSLARDQVAEPVDAPRAGQPASDLEHLDRSGISA